MGTHFTNLLREIIANPEKTLSNYQMISLEEQERLLYGFNATQRDFPTDLLTSQLFEKQVSQNQDQIALVYGGLQLTYFQLNQKANQLARVLRRNGIRPDSIVGIIAEPSIDMFIGMLAVLKAGGAYLPVDPDYPIGRIEYMLTDSKSDLILTDNSVSDQIQFTGQVLNLQDEELILGKGCIGQVIWHVGYQMAIWSFYLELINR